MNILKNKHMIMAMFIAPVLAIIAYFAVDHMVSETPQPAMQGKTYKLVASSNCRYQSGSCTLKNGDIEVQLRAQHSGDKQILLKIYSELSIQNIVMSVVENDAVIEPEPMTVEKVDDNNWQVGFYLENPENNKLLMALNISDSLFYVETSAIFIDYVTTFSRKNFSE